MSYVIAILIVVALGVGFTLFQNSKAEAPAAVQVTQEAPTRTAEAEVENKVTKSDYKDGSFSTDVTYLTPKRDEYGVNVSLTLKQDIITDAKVTYSNGAEKDPNAAKFEAAYKVQVIGKDIDTLELSRVGGASLTTGAFNNALVQIKADAKS
jgi:formylmethanofuran:tetrahydromethanopterin formyltransferase